MSLGGAASRGGIETTTEWKLIHALRQDSHRFSRPGGVAFSGGSTRTQELRNAINYLDVQIRRTFTILRLDLLLYLESEAEDDASRTSSESKTESETYEDSDQDDTSSQSSLESQPVSPTDDRSDSPGDSSSPSAAEALSMLTRLCFVLEARVNPLLSPREPDDTDHTSKFPRLTRLIEHLQLLSPSTATLDFIPTPRTPPTRFLFNIAEDEATAAAFVTFTDPGQQRPPKDTRKRMLADAEYLSKLLLSFNSFVDMLQISAGSLDTIATRPTENLASNESFSSFALLHKFRRQTATACRAVLSHFGFCSHNKHKALLQLPGWDDVTNYDTPDESASLPVHLFITMCLHDQWQPARMYFLQPEHSSSCMQRKLCKALSRSHRNDMDLEFYVSEDSKTARDAEIPIHVPRTLPRARIYGDRFPNHSLWALIEQGRFAKEQTLDLLYNTGGTGGILEIHERKALAIKLVVGLMLSMDSDHVFETWDPKRIRFLEPVETQRLFVSVPSNKGSSSHRKHLSLSSLYPSSSLEEDEEDLKPLPQFALLAKALLQIARGDRLSKFKIGKGSDQASWDAWNKLRRVVDTYSRCLACGPDVDRETLPLLQAALGCLNFHMEYQNRLRESQSSQKMEVAWKLVFDTILIKIDDNLTLKKPVTPSTNLLTQEDAAPEPLHAACQTVVQQSSVVAIATSTQTSSCTTIVEKTLTRQLSIRCVEPSQPNVELFDAKQDSTYSTANEFWTRLETFHKSYSRFVTHRNTVSGGDSPRRIRIAVIDTGIDFNHAGIMEAKEQGRMKEEWCQSWVGADAKDEDNELHGTNCAYLLHKAAPEADIYVSKVFNQNALRFYEAENIAKAIKHAANTWNVDIISMSFGLRQPAARDNGDEAEEQSARDKYHKIVDEIETAIRDASPRLIFAAASNSGKNDPRAFPANDDRWVICVHASEGNGEDGGINPEIQSGFNFMTLGMGLELMERENFVKNGRARSRFKSVVKSGTSFATPIAAGIAATVLDLVSRVDAINPRAKKKLKRPEGMEKMLRLMSTPKGGLRDRLYYMAPWHHWQSGWEMDASRSRWVWDTINLEVC
ncbi:hypothetical protein FOQG_17614 [Fusarium oxysporum f. sp. raphani 54005]|uniref:Uncharacterized protein n=2 Tax=Fusarium oxysporum f. sp. raphani TaxID=96318 RepID=X0BFU0_FUSOX|nr:hypothetical protein FOQG_17614 [Fusarium oxysporum f. sp. raphani 54005]KAG7432711.1 hypothetical protein Forpi1262_v007059 [Fusarium oxysporum f. sp. raphani]